MATKKYESMRIMSLEGSVVFKNDGFTATKDGKPDSKAFRGVLDESLDTLKLAEVYDRHKSELAYPYLDGKKRFCRAVVCLSFNRAIRLYESYGNRYVLNGHSVTDADMQDHVCISTVGGKPTLIAIDISFRENSGYAPVKKPIAEGILGKYFKYDADTRSYKRSDKPIPTDISCREIREHLYTHGFDIDGIHYVRYKRSAGASRDGRCLFIPEPTAMDKASDSEADDQPTEPKFEPYKPIGGKIRKPGTGCVTMINDHLYEGRFLPTRERQTNRKEHLRHHAGGVRGKAQGADCRDEKGDCGNQGGREGDK